MVGNTYAALQGATVDIIAVELADSHRRILMAVHLDECKSSIGLHTGFDDVAKVLEEGHDVALRGVRGEIANIACSLPLRGLLDNHVVALNAMSREVVMAKWSGWCHSHCCHCLLLGNGGLPLLISPVAADGARTEPFTIHRAQRLVSVSTVTEGDKTIATGAASLHVPHNASLGNRTKGREGL